jgi:hypothetical protein
VTISSLHFTHFLDTPISQIHKPSVELARLRQLSKASFILYDRLANELQMKPKRLFGIKVGHTLCQIRHILILKLVNLNWAKACLLIFTTNTCNGKRFLPAGTTQHLLILRVFDLV